MDEVKLPDAKEGVMIDRAKQAREVAERLFFPSLDRVKQEWAATIIEQALTAEHNATVEACARDCEINKRECANKSVCHSLDAASIRALLVEETVGEGKHGTTKP